MAAACLLVARSNVFVSREVGAFIRASINGDHLGALGADGDVFCPNVPRLVRHVYGTKLAEYSGQKAHGAAAAFVNSSAGSSARLDGGGEPSFFLFALLHSGRMDGQGLSDVKYKRDVALSELLTDASSALASQHHTQPSQLQQRPKRGRSPSVRGDERKKARPEPHHAGQMYGAAAAAASIAIAPIAGAPAAGVLFAAGVAGLLTSAARAPTESKGASPGWTYLVLRIRRLFDPMAPLPGGVKVPVPVGAASSILKDVKSAVDGAGGTTLGALLTIGESRFAPTPRRQPFSHVVAAFQCRGGWTVCDTAYGVCETFPLHKMSTRYAHVLSVTLLVRRE